MKVEKLDHIHVYVSDLEKAEKIFSRVLGTHFSAGLPEENLGITASLTPLGIELIQPISPDSAAAKALERRGEGLAGLSFKVEDIDQAVAELESQGLRVISTVEMGNIREVQFHPKDTCGVMLELCQYQEQHGALLASRGLI